MATEIYVNGERVTPDQIEGALARQERRAKTKQLFIFGLIFGAIGSALVGIFLLVAK